jgi:hypothetical protein
MVAYPFLLKALLSKVFKMLPLYTFLPKLHISLNGMIGRSNKVYNEYCFIFNAKLIARTLSPQKTSQIR